MTVAGLAGCGQTDYDGGKLRDDLVEAGLSRDEATCVVRAMEDTFTVQRLGAREEPRGYERDDFAGILDDCTGGTD